jgi:hypothetical protein
MNWIAGGDNPKRGKQQHRRKYVKETGRDIHDLILS